MNDPRMDTGASSASTDDEHVRPLENEDETGSRDAINPVDTQESLAVREAREHEYTVPIPYPGMGSEFDPLQAVDSDTEAYAATEVENDSKGHLSIGLFVGIIVVLLVLIYAYSLAA